MLKNVFSIKKSANYHIKRDTNNKRFIFQINAVHFKFVLHRILKKYQSYKMIKHNW